MAGRIRKVLFCAVLVLFPSSAALPAPPDDDRADVLALLAGLDDLSRTPEEMLTLYTEDVVILPPDEPEIRGQAALLAHLSGFGEGLDLTLRHEPVEITSFDEIVIVQGRVVGTASPAGDPQSWPFETKNIILMKRTASGLKVWKVIYNAAPPPS